MRIALITENSQAPKNALICNILQNVAQRSGHTVFNYGKYSDNDSYGRTYVQAGLLAAILLNAKAADFVVTGCGTGEGAMLACNAYPNVDCGLIIEPSDASLFRRINNGNAVSIPYAKGFGWGAELNLENVFEQLLNTESGVGYPEEWASAEKNNKETLDQIKTITHKDMLTILKEIDQDFLKESLSGESFEELFFLNCEDGELANYIKYVLGK